MTTKRLDDFNSNNKKGKGEKHVSYGKRTETPQVSNNDILHLLMDLNEKLDKIITKLQ